MSAKSKKSEQQSEAMLMRVIRVAEILAKGATEATHPGNGESRLSHPSTSSQSIRVQKTQT